MRKNCETCKHDRLKTAICDECYNTSDAPTKWEPSNHYKPDTNADRIRSMSDEELAKEMRSHAFALATCSEKAWLEWIQSPAE